MAIALNRLSATRVAHLKVAGRYADGGGLYLLVQGNGNRYWIFRYRDRVTGKLRDRGLGPLWEVPLARARQAAEKCRAQLRDGRDPIDSHRSEQAERALEHSRQRTFEHCLDAYLKAHRDAWRNDKHAQQWRNTLSTHASALLTLPITRIDTDTVIDCLQPIWSSKTETATRVRQRIETVIDWATARKYRTGENPARWRGHLDHLLAKPSRLKKVEHHPALPYREMATFLTELRQRGGLAARALELQILTATRPSEVVAAQWTEFDMRAGTWTIPGERMKAAREHRVALSPQATRLLEALPVTDEWVFPGAGKSGHLTTASMLRIVQDLRPGITTHGFRSSFRDWAAELSDHPREVAEAALAHTLRDKAEAAYQRGDLLIKRKHLMSDWASYCEGEPPGKRRRTGRSAV